MIDQAFILCLAVIAGAVVVVQARKGNAWPLVIVYWVVLTLKNIYNFLS